MAPPENEIKLWVILVLFPALVVLYILAVAHLFQ